MTEQINKLEKFVFLNIDFSSYSGCSALDKTIAKQMSLDDEVLNTGEVKIVSNKHLKVFGRYRAQARSIALRYGTGFMGGYAIPVDKWTGIKDELEIVCQNFITDSQDFIANYPMYVQQWSEQWINSKEVILSHAHRQDWVSTRFSADITAAFLSPAPGMDEELKKSVNGMFNQLCKELAVDARQAIKAYHRGSRITSKILKTFGAMIEKLNSLVFISPDVKVIAETLTDYLDGLNLPKTGKFQAHEESRVALILSLLTSEENIPNLTSLLSIEKKKIKKQELAESNPFYVEVEEAKDEIFFF